MSWKPANRPSRFPKWVPMRLRGPIGWVIKCGFVATLLLLAVAMFYFYKAQKFDMAGVAKMPERSLIIDRNGSAYGYVHGERRRLITRDEIPEAMVEALLAREDLRFYNHSGVDVRGLARATLRNLKDRSFTQGASTLTMQLARNSYNMRAKSLHRKFLEIALTLRVESHYSKDEILTSYLNRIYFGAGCHGVEEAAQTYFARSVSDLNAGECALLVGIIRGPHIFSPFRNIEGAKVQRDEVLERMVTCGFLTEDEKDNAMDTPIRLLQEKERNQNSSYARERIRRQLQIILDGNDIRSGGLKIYTTIDQEMQHATEELMKKEITGVKVTEGLQSAVIKVDPKTGGIMVLCGGRDYEESVFNRVYLAKRDLGPMYTPFLEAVALERSKVVVVGKPVQTGRQLGVEESIRLSKRLGFSGPFQKTEDLYRGSVAASPIEVARAASVIANEGRGIDLHLITKITGQNEEVIYESSPASRQPLSRGAASEALKNLQSNKGELVTCTSSCRDGWAMVVAENEVTVIWLGYDKPKKIGSSSVIKRYLKNLLEMLD